MVREMMEERDLKMNELDEILERLSVVYAEAMDLQRRVALELDRVIVFRSYSGAGKESLESHGPRTMPAFLGTGAVDDRIMSATMAALGKGPANNLSLYEAAQKELRWAESGGMING